MCDVHPQDSLYNPDLCMARKLAQEAPEVRHERITAAKHALQQGTLMLEADRLAERLLEDPLHRAQDEEV